MAGGDNLARRRNEDADCAVNRCSDLDLGELGLDGRRKDDLGIGDGALLDGRPGFAFGEGGFKPGEVTFGLFKGVLGFVEIVLLLGKHDIRFCDVDIVRGNRPLHQSERQTIAAIMMLTIIAGARAT